MSNIKDLQVAIDEWVAENHPKYVGWEMSSLAHEYNTCSLKSQLAHTINDVLEDDDYGVNEIFESDFDGLVHQVSAPEGYIYVVLSKNDARVGINIPLSIWPV